MDNKDICLSSTGSSFTCLDGVPFKISETCVQPNRVTLPLHLDTGNPSEIMFMEYDLNLESTVIQWGTTERFAKKQRPCKVKSRDDVEKIDVMSSKASDNGSKNTTETSIVATSSSVISPPNVYVSPSDILVPTQISATVTINGSNNAQMGGNIDLTDFESEQDPFENLSLCVINDREELDKVFFAVTKPDT